MDRNGSCILGIGGGINCVPLGRRGQKEDYSIIYEGNNPKLISGSKNREGETYSGDNWELKWKGHNE